MHILVEFKSREEFDVLCSHIQFKRTYEPEGIFKNHLSSCHGHSIARLKNFVWEGFNPYTSSGPGSSDDWSARFKVPIFTIPQFLEFVNTNPHLFI